MTSEIGPAITILAADTKLVEPVAAGWQLILAAAAGIALIVVLITVAKLHPFLALIFGAITVGIVAGQNPGDVLDSFGKGFGDTAASVGILIALGAMFAKLLADSGGADEIVDTIIGLASPRALPWAMALVGAIIGLPMFFEIGLVLLMPVIYLVAKRSQLSLITVGIPALAGLSAMHGLVPPHPGPVDCHRSLARRSRRHAGVGRGRRDPDCHRRWPAVWPPRRPLGGSRRAGSVRGRRFRPKRRWFGDHCRGGRRG
jgi:gluconate:H+ symporter, GntP family